MASMQLTLSCLLDQRGGRLEAFAIACRKLPRAYDEPGRPALVAIDVLQDPAGPAWEADTEDRADVRFSNGPDNALLQTFDCLDRLGEEHAFLEIGKRDPPIPAIKQVSQARPQPRTPAVLVVVKTPSAAPTRAACCVEHPVDGLQGTLVHGVLGVPVDPGAIRRILRISSRLSSSQSRSTGVG
jgi:hypothetical protein